MIEALQEKGKRVPDKLVIRKASMVEEDELARRQRMGGGRAAVSV